MGVSPDEVWKASQADPDRVADQEEILLSREVRALLRRALDLTGSDDAQELIGTALKELVERRRFQNWVDAHEHARHRHGQA